MSKSTISLIARSNDTIQENIFKILIKIIQFVMIDESLEWTDGTRQKVLEIWKFLDYETILWYITKQC